MLLHAIPSEPSRYVALRRSGYSLPPSLLTGGRCASRSAERDGARVRAMTLPIDRSIKTREIAPLSPNEKETRELIGRANRQRTESRAVYARQPRDRHGITVSDDESIEGTPLTNVNIAVARNDLL